MADATTTPTDQTHPLDAGNTTTEYTVAKAVTILSSVSAILGVAINILEKAQILLPGATWLNGLLIVGGIVAACVSQLIYTLSRVSIKNKALEILGSDTTVTPPGPGTEHDKAVTTLDE